MMSFGKISNNSSSNTKLTFSSIFCREIDLQFDCVAGENVSHKFPMHIHDSLCIGLITKGRRLMDWSNSQIMIDQNEIFIINKNQPHAIEQTAPHDYIAITIKGDIVNAAFENIIQSTICVNLFSQLYLALQDENLHKISEKWNNLYSYLSYKHKIYDSLSLNDDFIIKSLDYIQTNYPNPIVVNDIATHVNLSTYHFCRLFKQFTGLSPHNYLRQIRLSQSYKYLQDHAPIFDTAIATGFYDSSHFIKTFQSFMAVSPKKYQESIIKQ